MRRLFLDLDGVMADFDAHFDATFGVEHRGMPDDEFWQLVHSQRTFFRDLPPMPGAIEFYRTHLAPLRPFVLTACPKSDYKHVALQKKAWVTEHLGTDLFVIPAAGGSSKPLFMHAPGDVLIDDFERNTTAWEKAGGTAILHRTFDDTLVQLREKWPAFFN